MRRIPLLTPFFLLIDGIYALFYIFPLWLVGYWWCESCGKRFGSKTERIDVYLDNFVCVECHKQHSYVRKDESND
jgi:hypothetical protein